MQKGLEAFAASNIVILEGISGKGKGEKYVVGQLGCNIGRNQQSNYVHLDDPGVSKIHTAISFIDGEFHVKDVGSTNGTFVAIREPTPIQVGMELQAGADLFKIESLDNEAGKGAIIGLQGDFRKKKVLFGDKGLIIGTSIREGPDFKTEPTDRCSIYYSKKKFLIKDLTGQIKTWYRLSPERVESKPTPVYKGDYIKIGDTSVFFIRGYEESGDADVLQAIKDLYMNNSDETVRVEKYSTDFSERKSAVATPGGLSAASGSCKVCNKKEANNCAIPCGHLVFCGDCKESVSICPECKEEIFGGMTVHHK